MTESSKLALLLQLRKFWSSSIAMMISITLYRMGEISGDQLQTATTIVAGIYTGSTALEDGLRRVLTVWTQQPSADPAS